MVAPRPRGATTGGWPRRIRGTESIQHNYLPPDPQRILDAAARQGIAKGLELGRQEGKELGRQEGKELGLQEGAHRGAERVLRSLLIRRFGDLPGWVDARMKDTDADTLEDWSLRVLDAGRLEDVFA